MKENPNTTQLTRQADYRGYLILSTARTDASGAWVPQAQVTLRGRPIALGREPAPLQATGEDALCEALAWARRQIDQRELPASAAGSGLPNEV